MTAPVAAPADRVLGMLVRLFDGLRASGVAVSMAEVLDAGQALCHLDLADRPLVRSALQAVLVKRPEDVVAFRALFDQCFPLTGASAAAEAVAHASVDQSDGAVRLPGSEPGLATVAPGAEPPPPTTATSTDLLEALLVALRDGNEDALRDLAAQVVADATGPNTTRSGERALLYRALKAMDLSNLLVAAMRQVREEHPDADALTLRHERDELAARIELLRRLLAEEVQRAFRPNDPTRPGVGLVAPRRLEDLDVLQASTTELRQLRQAVQPLARKLASRVAERRRRHRRGRLDVRRTARRSLDTGGVPLDPAFRRKRPSKPQVVVLCDISGSVAEFAHFALTLLHALQAELRGLRSFVFVDGVAEVTSTMESATAVLDPRLLVTLPGVIATDGHSDYDGAFRRFLHHHASALSPSTTVIVTGDARTNHRGAGLEPLRDLRRRVKRVYWFNPEPADTWGEDDSAVDLYRDVCDGVFEVRSLTQLADAIAEII
jgi:uncharacterized protein with von Willebrand factor type A (vWA) domain